MEQMNFNHFKENLKKVISFREEWDNDDWNDAYIYFKNHVNELYRKEYVENNTSEYIATMWAIDFYQDATPETHSYWVT